MGKCESSSASIGIKILLTDLIYQINENNFSIIKEMLVNGFIEDKNDSFDEMYQGIIDCNYLDSNNSNVNCLDVKEYLINELKHNDYLFDKELLVPLKIILNIDRWGYDRLGTNSVSRLIDFDLSVNIEKYKEIEKIKIVFILEHNSG